MQRRYRFDPQSGKIPWAVGKLSPSTTSTEPVLGARELQPLSPSALTIEPAMPKLLKPLWPRPHNMRGLCPTAGEEPPLSTTRQKPVQQ